MLDELAHPDDVVEVEEEDETIIHPDDLEGLQADDEEIEPQSEEEPSEEAEEEQESVDELEALRSKIAELEDFIHQKDGLPTAEAVESLPFEIPKVGGLQVLTDDEDPSDFTMSTEGVNSLADRIVGIAVEQSLRLAYPIIQNESRRTVSEYDYSKSFFDKYPELRGQGELVAEVSEEIEKKNPKITPQKLALETAKVAYKKLGKSLPQSGQKRKPGFTNATRSSGNAGTARRKPGISDEVLDLVKHKERY